MKRLLPLILLLAGARAYASHIVGGEFELLYLSRNVYELRLIYYFDVVNNRFDRPPEQSEPSIDVAIFRKSDNRLMRIVFLPFASKSRVSYTQPECSRGEVVTDKMIYSSTVYLPDAEFSDPSGYYVIWERCCRNYTITNIISDEPPPGDINYPNAAGQTFYLEFPPVTMNGMEFVNSSPRLFPPLNDYACPGRPYYANFGGVDDDGDSLVYSLTVPLSTHTSEAEPDLLPAPYPTVKWQEPFSFDNIVGGDPDLSITPDGLLTVTPQISGLFVFAVKCEEFREGVKIGEVRRDFQMLVVTGCTPALAPEVKGRLLGQPEFGYDGNMSVTFLNSTPDSVRCIEVSVTDDDIFQDGSEAVRIRAVALNFKGDVSEVLPRDKAAVLSEQSPAVVFRICFDECPYLQDGPFRIGIIAADDACSLPLLDTLYVSVTVEPPANQRARFITESVNATLQEGEPVQSWSIAAVDEDGDLMELSAMPYDFSLPTVGMSFTEPVQDGDTIRTTFSWDPRCDIFDFSEETEFSIDFLVDDEDLCLFAEPDTLQFGLNILLPENRPPVISTSLPFEALEDGITLEVFDQLSFDVSATDADMDTISLSGSGLGFRLNTYNMQFPAVTGVGSVSSQYFWDLQCENVNLRERTDYDLEFVAVDSLNYCHIYLEDRLTVKVHVLPPANTKPPLTVTNLNADIPFEGNSQSIKIGQNIRLLLHTQDQDTDPFDNLTLDLVSATGNVPPAGYSFTPQRGTRELETVFTWEPDCSVFENAVYANDYVFTFVSADDRCFNSLSDTVTVTLNIRDVDAGTNEFLPPNVITPNGDGCNDYFTMEGNVMEGCGVTNFPRLPLDNCAGKFVSIRIYNRWGNQVYQSTRRDFLWNAGSFAAGVYFYTILYTNREYKGSISVRY